LCFGVLGDQKIEFSAEIWWIGGDSCQLATVKISSQMDTMGTNYSRITSTAISCFYE
jgi:hypothetical protein